MDNIVAGRGECVWDEFCHKGGLVANGETGDIACDSYHKMEEDIKLLKELKVTPLLTAQMF